MDIPWTWTVVSCEPRKHLGKQISDTSMPATPSSQGSAMEPSLMQIVQALARHVTSPILTCQHCSKQTYSIILHIIYIVILRIYIYNLIYYLIYIYIYNSMYIMCIYIYIHDISKNPSNHSCPALLQLGHV